MTKNKQLSRFSWQEYEKILKKLYLDIARYLNKNNLGIDVILSIMRGGGIPGIYLAYKLNVLTVLPLCYHYDFKDQGKMKLRQLFSVSRYQDLLPEKPVILLVEGNHCFGNTAKAALKDIKVNFPDSTVLYTADLADYGYKDVVSAEAVFVGQYTNECGTLTEKQAQKKGIFPKAKLLPWEVEKEEKETLKLKQFNYKDIKNFFDKSKVAEIIEIED